MLIRTRTKCLIKKILNEKSWLNNILQKSKKLQRHNVSNVIIVNIKNSKINCYKFDSFNNKYLLRTNNTFVDAKT